MSAFLSSQAASGLTSAVRHGCSTGLGWAIFPFLSSLGLRYALGLFDFDGKAVGVGLQWREAG